MAKRKRPNLTDLLTNLDQPMPLPEKLAKLTWNASRRIIFARTCCGNHGQPGC